MRPQPANPGCSLAGPLLAARRPVSSRATSEERDIFGQGSAILKRYQTSVSFRLSSGYRKQSRRLRLRKPKDLVCAGELSCHFPRSGFVKYQSATGPGTGDLYSIGWSLRPKQPATLSSFLPLAMMTIQRTRLQTKPLSARPRRLQRILRAAKCFDAFR